MLQKILTTIALALILTACGYAPLTHNTQQTLGEKIYIEVDINPRDAQNNVELKDSLSVAILERLHAQVTGRKEADLVLFVRLKNVAFYSLAENRTGFASNYSCEVLVEFAYTTKNSQKRRIFTKRGYYNFTLYDNAIITDSVRLEAINAAVVQTVDAFISQAGVER